MEQGKGIIKQFSPDIDDLSHHEIINAIQANKANITHSHKINGRWENKYLAMEYVPQIKKIFHFACRVGRDIVDNSGNIHFRKKIGKRYREWEISSQTGRMILFHSNIEHSVSKNNSKSNRISIAFNLYSLPIDIDSNSDSYSSNKFYS